MDNQKQFEKKTMRLHISAMTFASGILCGAAVSVTGVANLVWPGYGIEFLRLLASFYPGYKASGSIADLIVGILYALADGVDFSAWFLLGSITASWRPRQRKPAM
jgi:hypothetical protein